MVSDDFPFIEVGVSFNELLKDEGPRLWAELASALKSEVDGDVSAESYKVAITYNKIAIMNQQHSGLEIIFEPEIGILDVFDMEASEHKGSPTRYRLGLTDDSRLGIVVYSGLTTCLPPQAAKHFIHRILTHKKIATH